MPRRKRSKKWVYWVAVVALLAIAGVVVYFVWDGYFRGKEPVVDGGGSEVVQTEIRKKTEEKTTAEEVKATKEEVVQYEGGNPNESEKLTGVITYAGVVGTELLIRVNIDQFLQGGSCELGLRIGDNEVYTDTVAIVGNAATSTCEGFNVPLRGLETDDMTIVVRLSSGERTGEIWGEVER